MGFKRCNVLYTLNNFLDFNRTVVSFYYVVVGVPNYFDSAFTAFIFWIFSLIVEIMSRIENVFVSSELVARYGSFKVSLFDSMSGGSVVYSTERCFRLATVTKFSDLSFLHPLHSHKFSSFITQIPLLLFLHIICSCRISFDHVCN